MPTEVLLADDEVIYSAGMAGVLRQVPDLRVLRPVHTLAALHTALEDLSHGIVVVARRLLLNLPDLSHRAAQRNNHIVLLLSADSDENAKELKLVDGALRRGDSSVELLECVRAVAAGQRCILPSRNDGNVGVTAGRRVLDQLSARQLQVVTGIAAGAKNAEIARKIGTSEQVVKNMLRDIYDMTGVSDRLELALFVLHHPELATVVQSLAKAKS